MKLVVNYKMVLRISISNPQVRVEWHKEQVDERTDESIFQWFWHRDRIEYSKIAEKVYEECLESIQW